MHMKVTVSNVPVINLRSEFEDYLSLFRSDKFKNAIFKSNSQPVGIPNMQWNGMECPMTYSP